MTSSNGNSFRVTGHLCGEFTGHRWIPLTKASDPELWCFLWSAPEINGWVNNREAGDLRHHSAHYDVTVMGYSNKCMIGHPIFLGLLLISIPLGQLTSMKWKYGHCDEHFVGCNVDNFWCNQSRTILQPLSCHFVVESSHDDVIKWKHFPRYWPFGRGIHRSPVNSPHKGQWRGALMFTLIRALNKQLSKQPWGWCFETPWRPLWRHCNGVQQ